jgi:hypothetical protein
MKRVCFSLALFLAASTLRLKAQELEFTQVPADGTRLVESVIKVYRPPNFWAYISRTPTP